MDGNEFTVDSLFDDGLENPTPPQDPAPQDPVDPPTDPVDPVDPIDPAEPVDPVEPTDPVDPAPVDENLTGIEKFLSDYGILGGDITYEDGSKVNFNDLSSEEQYNVLQSLSETSTKTVEQEYGLDQDEVSLLNSIRNSGQSVQEFIQGIIEENVARSLNARESQSVNYKEMSDEAVYLKWLKELNPEISDEDAAANLETQKTSNSLFSNQAEAVRQQFIAKQEAEQEVQKTAMLRERESVIEADRHEIVQAVENITNIAGAEVSDGMKNEVLHSLLEINDEGDPLIMEELFSDPVKLFKATWFMKYGESYLDNYEKYWKRKESESYKKGRQDVLDGAPSTTNGMTRNNVVPKPGSEGRSNQGTPGRASHLDELWD